MTGEERNKVVQYRLNKAKETLLEVEAQIGLGLWNVAISRLYYACFYAVLALLASKEVGTKTHSGARTMFSLHFVKTGIVDNKLIQFYTELFSLRLNGDYEDFCDYEEEDVKDLVEPAREFLNTIERILYKG